MGTTYTKTKIDAIHDETIGDLLYSATIVWDDTGPPDSIDVSNVIFYLDGVRYGPFTASIAPSTTPDRYLTIDTSGNLENRNSAPDDITDPNRFLLGIYTYAGGLFTSTEEVETGSLVDRLSGTSVIHNNTLGLQGGTANQYFHLDQATYNNIQGTVKNSGVIGSAVLATHGANGLVINLTTPHPDTGYSCSFAADVNHTAASYTGATTLTTYDVVVLQKTTTTVRIRIVKKYSTDGGFTYTVENYNNATDGALLTELTYFTIDQENPLIGVYAPGYFEIQYWAEGTEPPTIGTSGLLSYNSFLAGGTVNDVAFQFAVPDNYNIGNQMNLVFSGFAGATGTDVYFGADVTVWVAGTDAFASPSVNGVTVDDVITLPTIAINTAESYTFNLTNTSGQVGGVQLSRGDVILVNFYRDPSDVSDTTSANFNLITMGVSY